MRILLLALATFSTLTIPSNAEGMLSWLRGSKKSGSQQGTEMGTLSSSVPCKPNLPTSSGAPASSQPTPPASRTMSTSEEDTLIFRERGSQHSRSYGVPIPSKSAPGTPIHTRRSKYESSAKSYTPETYAVGSLSYPFPMEDLDDEGPKPNPSASVPIPGTVQTSISPDQAHVGEASSFINQTPHGMREYESEEESPFPNFDEETANPKKSPSNMKEYITTSSQPKDGFTVGSAPGRKKINPNGVE